MCLKVWWQKVGGVSLFGRLFGTGTLFTEAEVDSAVGSLRGVELLRWSLDRDGKLTR